MKYACKQHAKINEKIITGYHVSTNLAKNTYFSACIKFHRKVKGHGDLEDFEKRRPFMRAVKLWGLKLKSIGSG